MALEKRHSVLKSVKKQGDHVLKHRPNSENWAAGIVFERNAGALVARRTRPKKLSLLEVWHRQHYMWTHPDHCLLQLKSS